MSENNPTPSPPTIIHMNCDKCGTQNPTEARFCFNCGEIFAEIDNQKINPKSNFFEMVFYGLAFAVFFSLRFKKTTISVLISIISFTYLYREYLMSQSPLDIKSPYIRIDYAGRFLGNWSVDCRNPNLEITTFKVRGGKFILENKDIYLNFLSLDVYMDAVTLKYLNNNQQMVSIAYDLELLKNKKLMRMDKQSTSPVLEKCLGNDM